MPHEARRFHRVYHYWTLSAPAQANRPESELEGVCVAADDIEATVIHHTFQIVLRKSLTY
jgi:hypothetical protein